MESIAGLKSSVAGVLNTFLIKEKNLIWGDTRVSPQIINSLYYLSDVIRQKQDLKRITIGADRTLFIYLDADYFLGVIATPSVNVPLLTFYINKVFQNIEETIMVPSGIKVEVREPNLFDKQNPMLPSRILSQLGIKRKGELEIKTDDERVYVFTVEEITDKNWDNYDVIMMNTSVRQRIGVTIGSYVVVDKKS